VFFDATRDSKSGVIYLKVVNTAGTAQRITVQINIVEPFSSTARDAEDMYRIKPRKVYEQSEGRYQDEDVFLGVAVACGPRQQIIPIIDRLCRSCGLSAKDIDHLYVSAGPGSFTGLRIGITLAKTMALATGVRLVAVPTVRVLAENAPADARHVVIVLDAKRDQIFTARFEHAGDRWLEREPAHLDRLDAVIARAPRPLVLDGEGLPQHRQFIPADSQIRLAPEELWRARASSVVKIGAAMAAAGQFADPFKLAPIYIRPPEAEEKYEAARAASDPLPATPERGTG
jgi:tRNA threonylcarbamoyladenosine biosynthesis protein TsaB